VTFIIRRCRGFSLIEVLMAIVLITVGLSSVYYLVAVSIDSNNFSKDTNLAYQAANEQMEHLRQMPYASLLIGNTTFTASTASSMSQLLNAQGTVAINSAGANLKKITLTVEWTRKGPGRDQNIKLTTLVARYGLNEKWK
jgi:prepilin-type N-terminal cleavage/methylation domain-containing protein